MIKLCIILIISWNKYYIKIMHYKNIKDNLKISLYAIIAKEYNIYNRFMQYKDKYRR